jgi:hypothetical protein
LDRAALMRRRNRKPERILPSPFSILLRQTEKDDMIDNNIHPPTRIIMENLERIEEGRGRRE